MFTGRKKIYTDKYESKTYNVGKIRVTLKFTNDRHCDLSLVGELVPIGTLLNSKREDEATDYFITTASDKLEQLLDTLEGDCKYIIADNGVIYNLAHNEIDVIEIKENGDLRIDKKVFLGVEVSYE